MPQKNAITLTELVILSVVWAACQNAWRAVIIGGLNAAVSAALPRWDRLHQNAVTGSLLMAVLYALILAAENVTVGRYRVFEVTDTA